MRCKQSSLLCLLALLFVISGCGTTEQQENTSVDTEKVVLTLAVVGTDTNLAKMIENYNAQSNDYIVELREYETSIRLFEASNDEADMFFLNSNLVDDLYFQEYCEDMTPFLAADPDFNSEDFVPGLYNGMLQNGSMLLLPYDFTILSYAVQPAVDAAEGLFTMDLANQIANERDELVFPAIWTRDTLLEWVSPYLATAYVDWKSMTCSFDTSDFIVLLEALKAHPASFEDIPVGKQSLLNYISIDGTCSMLASYEHFKESEGEEYALLGIPNDTANGSMFVAGQSFGIFSSSGNKEASWQFLRSLMSNEAQSVASNFPAINSAFERCVEEKVQSSTISQSGADKLLSLVDDMTCVRSTGNLLQPTIVAEVNAFFAGSCTAQEAADRIQQQATFVLEDFIKK